MDKFKIIPKISNITPCCRNTQNCHYTHSSIYRVTLSHEKNIKEKSEKLGQIDWFAAQLT
jgi:predicted metal-binding transcription factor (methanogenesis marker protein 9)